ncbi:MAG: polysaccharide deacetylase family protein [Firmicutes bacterium]|nr:polysaccharide deacetylase family protein [Bacillota bacterium]
MELSIYDLFIFSFLLYSIVPTVIIRFSHIGAVSRAPRGAGRIALTFDDGPDPRYTPQILEILGRYQVKACFFVVGRQARAYPELVRQIVKAGHEIGNHGFAHRIAWFLTPLATTREIGETDRAIEELTGQKAIYCRPAWGLFNLFSICYCRFRGLKVVLWTFMSWDWIKKATPEGIARKVLNRLRDGAILVFHDGDSTPGAARGAPARVVEALPRILEGVKERGLTVVPLSEITAPKKRKRLLQKFLRRGWSRLERVIRAAGGIADLPGDKTSILRVALRTYRGKDWPLPGGFILTRGDRYVELHLNNERLASMLDENTSTERMGLIALREARKSFPALVKMLREDRRYRDVKAVFAITLLHRALERLGFTSYGMRGILRPLAALYEKWLLGLYHPAGFESLKNYREKPEPRYVIMTVHELFSRYSREL